MKISIVSCMLIERDIFHEIKEHLAVPQCTVITGIRRCGKTTLVKMLLSQIESDNKIYIDLESRTKREIFEQPGYDNIIITLKQLYNISFDKTAYVALDEIQLVHNIPSVVKYLMDNYPVKFILTGSSSYYLKNLFTESLAGRKKIFELYTLNFSEFLKIKGISTVEEYFTDKVFVKELYNHIKGFYDEYIQYGGFPEVVLSEKEKAKIDLLEDILDSYLSIDIKNFADFQSYSSIKKILRILSSRVGNKLDISKISQASGVSRTTVSNYIELFEGTYLIKRIPVLSNNPEREIVKAQKLYMHDNGLLNMLADVSSGVRFENSVFNQIKHFGKLNYYSLKTGQEIDFVLNGNIAFEAKEHIHEIDYKKLVNLSKNLFVLQIPASSCGNQRISLSMGRGFKVRSLNSKLKLLAKPWEKIKIRTDSEEEKDAVSPLIVSASRSTDIPAFYSKWLVLLIDFGTRCLVLIKDW